MSLIFSTDTSTQLTYSNFAFATPQFDNYATSNQLLISSTSSSNYTTGTSNILVNRILSEIKNTSNYILTAQGILQNNINTVSSSSSNYTIGTSNILVNRILSEIKNTSNYVTNTSNILKSNIDVNNTNINTNTSNYISNTYNTLINNINDNISNLYSTDININTPIRQYPSKAYNTIENESIITFLGKSVYTRQFTLNTTGITYGSGVYTMYISSTYSASGPHLTNLLFDYNVDVNGAGAHFLPSTYDATGLYNGGNGIITGYNGEWVILKLPNPIFFTKLEIISRNGLISRAPAEWRCYGSNDGINFIEITTASQLTRLIAGDYVNNTYTKSFNNLISYSYIGFTFNKIVGNGVTLNFIELKLFGQERIQPYYISSNVFNSTLTNYYNQTQINGLLTNKQNTLTFTSPLTNTANTISIDLTSKENALTFNSPLTRTTNTIGINLGSYYTKTETDGFLTNKQNTLTFTSPLTNTANTISIDLSSKENVLTFSSPLTRTTNTIGINLGSYSTTGNDVNYVLKTGAVMTGQITGVTTLNATTVISGTLSTTNNTNVVAPTKGIYGGNGDRLILWAGTSAAYPFSLGIDSSTLWYSVPDGSSHKFYHNGSVITTISSTGLSLGNPVGYKVLSLWDNATPNNFQFVGFGNNGGLCLNTNTSTDAFQFRVGTSTTTANELMRINGNGSVCIGTASATSVNTKLTISGTSSAASQPIVRIEQLAAWDGSANNYAFQVSGYSDLGGIRINGTDTYNTIFTTGNNDMGLSTKAGVIKFLTNSGNERMRILNNGNVGIGTNDSSSKLTVEGRTITGNGSSTYSSIFNGNTVGLTVANTAGTGNPEQLVICDTANANTALLIGSKYNAGDAFSVIQSIVAGAGYKTLSLNPNGGNIGIGTTNPSALLTLTSPTQSIARILLSGQEFYAGGFSQTSGIALLLGVNRDNNKQLWITNSANLAQNATNAVVRIGAETSGYIDCIATNGTTWLPMTIGGSSITLNNNTDINGNLTIGSYITIPKSTTSTGILNLALGGTDGADNNTNMKILMYGVNSGSGGVSGSIVIRAYNDIKFFSNGQGTTPNLFIDGIYGLVGVGGITPVAKLHVASGTYTTGWLGNIALINSGSVSVVYWGNTFGGICAIFETNIWCKTNIMASSDSRIKKDIEDIDDTTALDKILSIQPKTYKYKDTLLKRDNRVIGFIAQQIKEVIPEAVELIPEYIPNIYKISTTNDDIINLDNTELLNVDDKIKIIDNSGKTEETKILEVNETSIKIDKTFNNEDVFVYGSKVDDFHSLDKSYIYTLNVCATQQLYKLIQLQEERIRILEEKLASF